MVPRSLSAGASSRSSIVIAAFALAVLPTTAAAQERDSAEASESEAEEDRPELVEACPGWVRFWERLQGAMEAFDVSPTTPSFDVEARLELREEGGFRLVVETEIRGRSRRVVREGERCEELVALATQLTDSILGEARRGGVAAHVLATAFADVGTTPAITGGERIALQLFFGRGSLLISADLLLPGQGAIQGSAATIGVIPIAAGAHGCVRPIFGELSLDLCGGVVASAMLASFEGVERERDAGLLLSLDLGAMLSYRLLREWSLLVSADLLLPFTRPSFDVAGVSDPVTSSESVAGRLGVGLAFHP